MKKYVVFAGIALVLTACQDSRTPTEPRLTAAPAPNAARAAAGPELVPGDYIVVFRSDVADPPGLAKRLAESHGGALRHTYSHAIKGFAAHLSDAAAAALARQPQVAYVEQDQVMYASTTETNATWGLDRVDQRALPLSGTYTYTPSGAGVTAYIIDTGIRFD